MDWATHEPQIRFDIRAEREECEQLFRHQARALQDRIVRRGRTDRTRQHAIPEWEKFYQTEAQERRLLHQARVLSWGKEKRYYYGQGTGLNHSRRIAGTQGQTGSAPEFLNASFHSGLRPAAPAILDNARRLRHNSLC